MGIIRFYTTTATRLNKWSIMMLNPFRIRWGSLPTFHGLCQWLFIFNLFEVDTRMLKYTIFSIFYIFFLVIREYEKNLDGWSASYIYVLPVVANGRKNYILAPSLSNKYKSLNDLLVSIVPRSAADQKQILNSDFEAWKGSLEQVDDVCIVGIKI